MSRLVSMRMRMPGCRAILTLLVVLAGLSQPALAQAPAPAAVEHYGGEAWLGSEPPIPVHLEVRRSGDAVTGAIRSHGAEFALEDARGHATVTGTLGGPGGGPIAMRFGEGRVEGEFELGGQRGRFAAAATSLDHVAFFAEPRQRLDLTTAEWVEDLDRLVEILATRHGSPFHRVPEAAFRNEVARIRSAIPALGGPGTVVEFRKLAAMIGDGHTFVASAEDRPRLPIEAYWFEDGIRLVAIAADHRELLGSKLIAIAGVPIGEAVERLRPYIAQGETAWSFRYVAPFLIADPDVLDDAGLGASESRSFTFEGMDGSVRTIALDSGARVPLALLGGARPFWQRDPEQGFRVAPLADGALYLNWRSYDRLSEQATALIDALEAERPGRLIVDLRDSGGGDFNEGRDFIRRLAALSWLNRPDRLFVLLGRRSFSAAMTNAVDFRRLTRATLIGEPAGAAPNNWQEVRFFHLPNSGLRVGVSTRYYEFLPGEREVRPDIFIPPAPADWGGELDGAVRYVLALPCPAP